MELQFIQDALNNYHEVTVKVRKAALEKLKTKEGKDNKGRDKPYIGYLIMRDFYVEDDKSVVVCFGFDGEGPYSGNPEVILTADEVAAL